MAKKEMAKVAGTPLKISAETPTSNTTNGNMKAPGPDPKYPMSDMKAGQDIQKGYRTLSSGMGDGDDNMDTDD